MNIIKRHGFQVHLYADDSQLYIHIQRIEIQPVLRLMEACVAEIQVWSGSRRLKLNTSKTEFIVFDRNESTNIILQLGSAAVKNAQVVRDLGVILDSCLSLKANVSAITKSCFYHLRRLRLVKNYLDNQSVMKLVYAFILSRIDRCNSILVGLPDVTVAPITRVLHAAARLISGTKRHEHITPILRELHWLPLQSRIRFKLCVLMHGIKYNHCPDYLRNDVVLCSEVPTLARLRSSTHGEFVKRRANFKYGKRAFSVAGPNAWNKLSTELKIISSVQIFKKKLKKFLFDKYYK